MKTKTKNNARTVASVVRDITTHNQNAFQSKLAICQLFAEGWGYYLNGDWNDAKVSDFLARLHIAGLAPDPKKTITASEEGGYSITSSCGTFFSMLTVGTSELFEDSKVLEACRVSSISTLYSLVRFYNLLVSGGSKPSIAKRRLIAMFSRSGELTRETVNSEIAKMKQKNKDLDTGEDRSEIEVRQNASLDSLSEEGKTFDAILVTPPDDVLDQLEQDPNPALRFGLDEVREVQSHLCIKVSGNRLGAALRWSKDALQINNPRVYCLSEKAMKGRVLDVSEMVVVVSNFPMSFKTDADIDDAIAGAMVGDRKLIVYGEAVGSEWSNCNV